MRYTLRFTLTLVLVAIFTGAEVFGVGVARAEPEPEDHPLPRPVRLEYTRALRSCPDAETLERTISTHAPRDLFDPTARTRLTVTISRQGLKFKATVEVHDAEGASVWSRPFTPLLSCDVLGMDIALTVGERFSLPPPAPPPVEPAPLSSAPPPPPPPPPPTRSPSPPRSALPPPRLAGRFAASGGPSFGVAPADVAAVMSLEGGAQWRLTPDWLISGVVGVLYSPPASTQMLAPLSRAQVEVTSTLLTSLYSPCVHRHIRFGWVFGCMGLELGRREVAGANISHPASAITFWAAVDPRLGIEVPLEPLRLPHLAQFALRFFGDIPISLYRPTVVVGEGPSMSAGKLTQVWVTPAVTGALSVGLVAWFDG